MGTVRGQEEPQPWAEYWAEQVEAPVRFWACIERLWSEGFRAFVELGAEGQLCALGQQGLGEQAGEALWLPLRAGRRGGAGGACAGRAVGARGSNT